MLDRLLARRTFLPFLALACLAAYLPALQQRLHRGRLREPRLGGQVFCPPGFLFTVPPQNFRMTSFVVFEGLKRFFGYRPEVWYAVNTLFHFIACLLLWQLLRRLEGERTAALATLLFAVFQAPQEAVMWVSAMNETISGIFILATLLLWTKNKHGWALLCYSLALVSKESAPILLTTDSSRAVAPEKAARHARVSSLLHTDGRLRRGLPEDLGREQHDPLPDLCNQPPCAAGTRDHAAPAVVAVAVCVSRACDDPGIDAFEGGRRRRQLSS